MLGIKSQISPRGAIKSENSKISDVNRPFTGILPDTELTKQLKIAQELWTMRSPAHEYRRPKGGQLIDLSQGIEYQNKNQTGGGERGRIDGFSKRSVKTMRRRCYSINMDEADEINYQMKFITLTYANPFPDNQKKIKRDLDAFSKRFERKFGNSFFIWKLEAQEREAPHYHLVVMVQESDPIDTAELQQWVATSWTEIVYEFQWGRDLSLEDMKDPDAIFDWPDWCFCPVSREDVLKHYAHHRIHEETVESVPNDERGRIKEYVMKYTQKRGGSDGHYWGERWGIKGRFYYDKLVDYCRAVRISRPKYLALCDALAEYLEEEAGFGEHIRSERVTEKTVYIPQDKLRELLIEADVPISDDLKPEQRNLDVKEGADCRVA